MSAPWLTVAPPLPWNAYGRRPAASLPFPFHDGQVRLYPRARHGLFEGLQRLGLGTGHVALVPAYHHGSEIEAYVRAGLVPSYYDIGPDMAPNEAELEARVHPGVRVLHLTHYLGFSQEIERWRAWCDRRGICLVEDTAQGWLGTRGGRPLGSWGELSLFSIYKTIGLPDGGAAALRGTALEPSGRRALGVRRTGVKHAAWFAARWPLIGSLRARQRGASTYAAEKDFSLGNPHRGAAVASSFLVPRLVAAPVAEQRVRNYKRLLAGLRAWVPDPFRRDPEGLSPFAFPVIVADKPRSIAALQSEGIRAVDAWSVPHPTLPLGVAPEANRLRSGLLLLPVHQELRPSDLERIVAAGQRALGPPRSA